MYDQWDRWIEIMMKADEQGLLSSGEKDDLIAFVNLAQLEKRKLKDNQS